MAKRQVRLDEIGIWVSADGMISRPAILTQFSKGDEVQVSRHEGIVTVTKGNITEHWVSISPTYLRAKTTSEKRQLLYDERVQEALTTHGHIYWKEIIQ